LVATEMSLKEEGEGESDGTCVRQVFVTSMYLEPNTLHPRPSALDHKHPNPEPYMINPKP
jgi:hypothetical protein